MYPPHLNYATTLPRKTISLGSLEKRRIAYTILRAVHYYSIATKVVPNF